MTSSTMTRNDTTITVEPGQTTIVVTREFDAPRERVFRAFTDPELVARWLGPRNQTMTVERYDARGGGDYRYLCASDDGRESWFRGVFHEVREPEHITQTFQFEPLEDAVALEHHVFEDVGGRTRLTMTSIFESVAARDGMVASGMDEGVFDSMDRLAELLADGGEHPS